MGASQARYYICSRRTEALQLDQISFFIGETGPFRKMKGTLKSKRFGNRSWRKGLIAGFLDTPSFPITICEDNLDESGNSMDHIPNNNQRSEFEIIAMGCCKTLFLLHFIFWIIRKTWIRISKILLHYLILSTPKIPFLLTNAVMEIILKFVEALK